MRQVTLVVPGAITTRTGGSIYDRRIADGLRVRGWTVSVVELEPFVHPLAPPLRSAEAQFGGIPDGSLVLVDGLAFGTIPEIIEREGWRLRFVPIVHMPVSATPGLTRGDAAWLSNLERRALVHAKHVLITGTRTESQLQGLAGHGQATGITRISPGTNPTGARSRSRRSGVPLRLLCVANVTPGKGYDVLLRAFAGVATDDCVLLCVGSTSRDQGAAESLRGLADDLGLTSRVTWAGELDDAALAAQYDDADVFVLATRAETYGMAVAEAIAHGLPVVSTRTGDIPSIVGEGGLLAQPDDEAGFAAILDEVIGDAALRQRLAAGARTAALNLPTWDEAADAVSAVLMQVVRHA